MPQMQLPIFSEDVTLINSMIGYAKRDGRVYYFNGQMPLFVHNEDDEESFKMFIAQLYVTGNATQAQINKTFGFKNAINMKRWVKKYREGGPSAFYKKEQKRKARVMTAEVIKTAQRLLDEAYTDREVAEELGLKVDTLRKAVQKGKLHRSKEVKKNNREY